MDTLVQDEFSGDLFRGLSWRWALPFLPRLEPLRHLGRKGHAALRAVEDAAGRSRDEGVVGVNWVRTGRSSN